jgi:hypothetical protein
MPKAQRPARSRPERAGPPGTTRRPARSGRVTRQQPYELRECRMPAVKVSSRCANVSSKCREA